MKSQQDSEATLNNDDDHQRKVTFDKSENDSTKYGTPADSPFPADNAVESQGPRPRFRLDLKEEFQLKNFGLAYDSPSQIIGSQWPLPTLVYLIWRSVWYLAFGAWIVISVMSIDHSVVDSLLDGLKWCVYLSNLTGMLTTLTCMLDMCIAYYYLIVGKESIFDVQGRGSKWPSLGSLEDVEQTTYIFRGTFTGEEGIKYPTKCSLATLWFLYSVVYSPLVLCSIEYWVFRSKGDKTADTVGSLMSCIFVVLNLFMSAMPIRVLHCVYPMTYVSLYIGFTFVSYKFDITDLQGRQYIMNSLKWDEPVWAGGIAAIIVFIFVPVTHTVIFAIYKFRLFLRVTLIKEEEVVLAECATCKRRFHCSSKDSAVEYLKEGKIICDQCKRLNILKASIYEICLEDPNDPSGSKRKYRRKSRRSTSFRYGRRKSSRRKSMRKKTLQGSEEGAAQNVPEDKPNESDEADPTIVSSS